ncbi:MAG TPA: protein kinase, partial [Isosphaeraceae bacterium]|nr:protein kinase [Isosphaeraceae bacterium]
AGWAVDEELRGERFCLAAPAPPSVDFSLLESAIGTHLADWGLALRSVTGFKAEMGDQDAVVGALMLPPCPPGPADEHLTRAGFTVLEELGQDDHGTVHKARERTGRIVSVLVLKNPAPLAGREIARLEKELIGLKHPAIIPILKLIYNAQSGLVFAVVSKYVAGRTLTQWISQNGLAGPCPSAGAPRAAARLVLTLAEGLEYAGRKTMIHGILTPEKIQIGDDGSPRITGFGLIRLGCVPKLSEPTAQTDVYSLGAIFRQLLTAVPQIPADLETICLKAMATDPAKRYATAGELAADLRNFLGIKPPGLLGRVLGKPK